MIDLNCNFDDPNVVMIHRKVNALLSGFENSVRSKDISDNQYILIYRSLIGGYEILPIPIRIGAGGFVKEFSGIKEQIEASGMGFSWEDHISSFVCKSQTKNGSIIKVFPQQEVASLICCFIVGFMELKPDKIFIDNESKVVIVDQPLYSYVVKNTDEWMAELIDRAEHEYGNKDGLLLVH